MADSFIDVLNKYWTIIAAFLMGLIAFVTTRGNTEANARKLEEEREMRLKGDLELKQEIERVEERIIQRQKTDTDHINTRFDDLKGDMSEVRKNVNELLRRGN